MRTNHDAAEYILGCCETWGMLPPPNEEFFAFQGYGKYLSKHPNLQWEHEDD